MADKEDGRGGHGPSIPEHIYIYTYKTSLWLIRRLGGESNEWVASDSRKERKKGEEGKEMKGRKGNGKERKGNG